MLDVGRLCHPERDFLLLLLAKKESVCLTTRAACVSLSPSEYASERSPTVICANLNLHLSSHNISLSLSLCMERHRRVSSSHWPHSTCTRSAHANAHTATPSHILHTHIHRDKQKVTYYSTTSRASPPIPKMRQTQSRLLVLLLLGICSLR